MQDKVRILVTGDREDLSDRCPTHSPQDGRLLEWKSLPVLQFEKLAVDPLLVERVVQKPFDWIFFTSHRTVQFWTEILLEFGVDFPVETQVACIGEQTAAFAESNGFTPDFYPTESGTEKFLEEFEDLLSNNSVKPSILLPMAEGGRQLLSRRLSELGCEVTCVSVYRTMPLENLPASFEEVEKASLILFTSPSSVEAFLKHFPIPKNTKIASIGRFTSQCLADRGLKHAVLPGGDFQQIGEILCQ